MSILSNIFVATALVAILTLAGAEIARFDQPAFLLVVRVVMWGSLVMAMLLDRRTRRSSNEESQPGPRVTSVLVFAGVLIILLNDRVSDGSAINAYVAAFGTLLVVCGLALTLRQRGRLL